MTRPWIVLCVVAAFAALPVSVESRAKSKPPVPSLSDRRAEELLAQARQARDEGRAVDALELCGRAYRMSPRSAEIAATEALETLDGLRLELVSGDRQSATPTTPPRAPLIARVTLQGRDGRAVAATGVPIAARWSAGEGELSGEMSSDPHGMVTIQVLRLPDVPGSRLEAAVDADSLPFVGTARGEHVALVTEALEALNRRTLAFEFVRADMLKKSRILVLIEESVFGEPVRESVVADQMTTALVDQGMRVIGTTEIGKSNLEKIQQSLDRTEWNAVRGELLRLCDLLVYGRVEVRRDYVNAGGGMWSVARGRVGIYGVYSPEILGSVDYSDIAVLRGDTWENGAEECLRRCAVRTREKLMPLIVRAASEPSPTR